MQTLKIEATPRADFGKKASRAIRREGQVPCVLYGGGETVSFSVDAKALKPLIYTPNSYIVELTIGGKTEKAVMREVQFHPCARRFSTSTSTACRRANPWQSAFRCA